MGNRNLIRFDWAIKRLLRNKADYKTNTIIFTAWHMVPQKSSPNTFLLVSPI